MAGLDKNVSEINQILNKEIKRVKRSTLLNIVFTGVMLCMLLLYYMYVSTSLKKVLNEKEIVLIVRQTVSDFLADLKPEMEQKAKAAAPGMVSSVLDTAEKTIPQIRAEANKSVKEAIPQLFDQVDKILHAEIKEKASPYRQEIAAVLERLSDDKLAEAEFKDLEVVIEQAFFDEIDNIIDLSYASMVDLNQRIDGVISVEDLTQEQLLEKKFLKMWVNFFKWNYAEK